MWLFLAKSLQEFAAVLQNLEDERTRMVSSKLKNNTNNTVNWAQFPIHPLTSRDRTLFIKFPLAENVCVLVIPDWKCQWCADYASGAVQERADQCRQGKEMPVHRLIQQDTCSLCLLYINYWNLLLYY